MDVHGLKVDVEGAEFDYPLGDSSSSIFVPQDVTERVVSDDGDRVFLEVVSQLPRGNEHCIQ
jgi:hypothetical protein